MPRAQWQRDLAAVRKRTPYLGYGGLRKLAEDMGVSYVSLRKWAAGMGQPSAENRAKLAAALREGTSK